MKKELCDNCGENMVEIGGGYSCPFSEDILLKNNICNCCDICRQECLDEI